MFRECTASRIFLTVVILIGNSIISHTHLFPLWFNLLLSEAKGQWEKDTTEEGAVWKKTESKILMHPNKYIMGVQELGAKRKGDFKGWGSPLFTLMVSRWCGGRFQKSQPDRSATGLAVLSHLHKLTVEAGDIRQSSAWLLQGFQNKRNKLLKLV